MANKPIVLHLGDAIRYNHAFYNEEFLARFKVMDPGNRDQQGRIHASAKVKEVSKPQSSGL